MEKRVLGNTNAGPDADGANYLYLTDAVCTDSGIVTKLKVKTGAAGNVRVGLYDNNAGAPNNLLAQAVTVAAGDWVTVPITPVPVTAGTTYWLAFCSDTAGATRSGPQLGRITKYKAYAYGVLPNPAGGGYTNSADTQRCLDAYIDIVVGGLSMSGCGR
ncbi:MAG: hypothetical protein V1701_02945 [Planctomycetota bacterium]